MQQLAVLVNLVRLAIFKASFLLWLNLVLYCNKQLVCAVSCVAKNPLFLFRSHLDEGVHGLVASAVAVAVM